MRMLPPLLRFSERSQADLRLHRDHITELNSAKPKQPFFFLKPASSILAPGAGPVVRPRGVDMHYEVELALIMGKQVKDLEASDEKTAFESIESMSSAKFCRQKLNE
jgi:acylpyruvate hydrolase